MVKRVSKKDQEDFDQCVQICRMARSPVSSVCEYMGAVEALPPAEKWWFRGHRSKEWTLTPSALRFDTHLEQDIACDIISEFRRLVSFRIPNGPDQKDELGWMQLARHYGLPTRLLDWTANAAAALYFACESCDDDGAVFAMNPLELSADIFGGKMRVLDPTEDFSYVSPFLGDGRGDRRSGKKVIAIEPALNNERIQAQRGAFTIHKCEESDLTSELVPSLVFIPIRKGDKAKIIDGLSAIGVDEMSVYPELEHVCNHLKKMIDKRAKQQ